MTIDGNVAQPGGGNDDPAYVVFGYGSLIFRVRKTALTTSRLTFEPRYALAPTARHQRKYVAFRCSCAVPEHYTPAPGFLKGYIRRFAQKSHDHRGTPTVRCPTPPPSWALTGLCFAYQSPGRVVTLVHQEDWTAFSSAVRRPHPHLLVLLT